MDGQISSIGFQVEIFLFFLYSIGSFLPSIISFISIHLPVQSLGYMDLTGRIIRVFFPFHQKTTAHLGLLCIYRWLDDAFRIDHDFATILIIFEALKISHGKKSGYCKKNGFYLK